MLEASFSQGKSVIVTVNLTAIDVVLALQIIQTTEVQSMGLDITSGVVRRVAARSLQLLLQPPQVPNGGSTSDQSVSTQVPMPTLPALPVPLPSFSFNGKE